MEENIKINEEVIARRAEVRKLIAEVDRKKNEAMRAEKDRHYEELREAYGRHSEAVRRIESEAAEERCQLKEELDRLGQMLVPGGCPLR